MKAEYLHEGKENPKSKRDRLIYGLGLLNTVVALITWDSTISLSALILMCTDRIIYEIRKIKSWKEN